MDEPPLGEKPEPTVAATAVVDDEEPLSEPHYPPKLDGTAPPKPEDLVSRAIAPVMASYLRPHPARHYPDSSEKNYKTVDAASESKDEGQKAPSNAPVVIVVQEKKSKRQFKRERKQERKSARNICPEIAKTGDVHACRFGVDCRFSHDLDGFLAQKPSNLPGSCPFIDVADSCPYGAACMFSGTHKEFASSGSSDDVSKKKKSVEVNSLNKDLQKLLWKKKVKFLKADAQLKVLGLLGKNNSKAKAETVLNGSDTPHENVSNETTCKSADEVRGPQDICLEMDLLGGDASGADDHRPSKKVKSPVCSTEVNNGTCHMEEVCGVSHSQVECEDTTADHYHGSKVELIPVLNSRERKLIDFRRKLYLAPLTTVGNLPFRRICKNLGADITCGEMAMCTNLLQGQASEWALLRRHSSEDVFGVQICGAYPDTIAHTVELIDRECSVDFIDINMGCPIDIVVNKGAGSSLLTKPMRMKNIIQAACGIANVPLTVKVRTGYFEGRNRIDSLVTDISQWGASAITIHGRSRQQRYSKLADWDYIYQCARKAPDALQVLGNGDAFAYLDWNKHNTDCPQLSTCMVARGALIKPWIFTEIKEQRHWDITSGERFGILKDFAHFGLEHWGSDSKGVETTRHFLLEWLSYTHRYIPVGLLDVVPQRLNWRPPSYFGRDDLETLMASDSAADWIRLSEMLLGKVPDGFTFAPKHKSNAYDRAENG